MREIATTGRSGPLRLGSTQEDFEGGRGRAGDSTPFEVLAALPLSEYRAQTPEATAEWLKRELDRGLGSPPGEPADRAFWDRLRGRLRDPAGPGDGR